MRFKVPDSPLSSPEASPPSSPTLSPTLVARRTPERHNVQLPQRRSSDTSVFSNEDNSKLPGPSSISKHRRTATTTTTSPRGSTWECREFYAAVKLRQRRDPVEENQERERQITLQEAQEESARSWKPISDLLNLNTPRLGPSNSSSPLSEFQKPPTLDERIQYARSAQLQEVQHILGRLEFGQAEMKRRRADMEARQKKELWDSINQVIQVEEATARRIAEEKAAARRAEEERQRKIEEEQQRKIKEEEEAKRRAEEAEADRKAKVEADKRRKEEEEQRAQEKAATEQKEREEREVAAQEADKRQGTAPQPARFELQRYWDYLQMLKNEVMPTVRAKKGDSSMVNPEWKKVWSTTRRSFTPKIGQVTNSISEINRIANLIHTSLSPSPPHPERLYIALLSSLAKAFLLQAETEVTAKPNTAFPLARLVLKILELGHHRFADIFMARLLGRSGGWALATTMPRPAGQTDDQYRKMLGYTADETSGQYIDRVVGMITLYFAILQTPLMVSPPQPSFSFAAPAPQSTTALSSTIPPVFQFHRTWTWLARVSNNAQLMSNKATPQVIYAVAEVVGDKLMAIYGKQAVKWRKTLERKCIDEGPGGEMVGGPEGKAARVRLGLRLQKWEKEGEIGGDGREIGR